MKKRIISWIAAAVTLCALIPNAFACTTILVGKDASADGSAYVGRTDDHRSMAAAKLDIFPASDEKGTYQYVDPINGAVICLPKANRRCVIEPICKGSPDIWWESGINDANVGISATETIRVNSAVLELDPLTESGLCEGNIPRLVLPYISSAKEGVLRLASLVEKYGMTSSEGVAFVDEDEIWYMEIYSGHNWAAHRLPDDAYACMGNDCLLDFYDARDTKNWLGSKGLIKLAKKAGTYQEADGRFHLALSFGEEKRDYSQLRIWASRRFFNGAAADSYDGSVQYSFSEKPDHPITLEELFALTRDRHENTPMATDVVGDTRPIAIDRTAQSHFLQYKKGCVPVMWSCLCAPEFGVYLPVYANAAALPAGLTVSTPRYDETSFSWQLRLISDLAIKNRGAYSALVRSPFMALESDLIRMVAEMPQPSADEAAQALQQVSDAAWKTMNEVKIELITEVASRDVAATQNLGRD